MFLELRGKYNKINHKAKLKFFTTEKNIFSDFIKRSHRKLWQKINEFRNKNESTNFNVPLDEFVNHFANMPRNTDINDLEVNLNEILVDFLDKKNTKGEILKPIS
jgi:predicted choloylglycine hydrolase